MPQDRLFFEDMLIQWALICTDVQGGFWFHCEATTLL